MGGFAEHLHLQLFCEKGMRSHWENAVQAHKEEQKKSLKTEKANRVHIVERRNSCSVIRNAVTATRSDFR